MNIIQMLINKACRSKRNNYVVSTTRDLVNKLGNISSSINVGVTITCSLACFKNEIESAKYNSAQYGTISSINTSNMFECET